MKKHKIKIQKDESWDKFEQELNSIKEEIEDKVSEEYYYISEDIESDLKAKDNYEIEINVSVKKKNDK